MKIRQFESGVKSDLYITVDDALFMRTVKEYTKLSGLF
jgi:hypothetical protein